MGVTFVQRGPQSDCVIDLGLHPFIVDISQFVQSFLRYIMCLYLNFRFLYFTIFDKKGLFRRDLAHFSDDNTPLQPLIDSDLRTFVLDYESFLLYLPNNPQNTIMSAYLDGTGLTDVRQGTVVRPYFVNIVSMVLYDGKFFWTNGSVLYSEEYDKNGAYYHNALALLEKHFCGFNLYYPSAQPIPIPTNPPAGVQVLFTAYKAIIQWEVPVKLQFQGKINSIIRIFDLITMLYA